MADVEKLPDDNDVVILGTGMTASIISAALSRIELRVLNLDKNDHYGSCWGSFNLSGMKEFFQSQTNPIDDGDDTKTSDGVLNPGEKIIPIESQITLLKNIEESSYNEISQEVTKCDVSTNPCNNVDDVNSSSAQGQEQSIKECDVQEMSSERNKDEDQQGRSEENETPINEQSKLYEEMMAKQRYFTLDLLPKMMYSRGSLVELLISSDVARYCEFKLVSRIITLINNKFQNVPCSRSEVFSTSTVSIIEKRMLMKFLNFALEFEKHGEEYSAQETMPFVEFLKEKKLSPTLQHYIQHAIAMVPNDATTLQGLIATQKYLASLGRYGNSAFLSPLYGTGELLQCFCRLSSVFGGTYCLRRPLSEIIVNENKIVGVVDSNGQRLKLDWLVMDSHYASQFVPADKLETRFISRAILITNKSIHPDKEQHITLANIPSPVSPETDIIVQEMCSSLRACPENFFIIHLICNGSDAKSDLSPFVEKYFNCPSVTSLSDGDQEKPDVLWMAYFNLESVLVDPFETPYDNLIIVPGPDVQLDCDSSVKLAEKIFKHICPSETFLPKAPSPEEIIFGDASGEGSLNVDGVITDQNNESNSNGDDEVSTSQEDTSSSSSSSTSTL